ncbi:aminoglycoside phosphotransferase family protein [Nonomuraea sp. NPDC050404]|uniref:aminoglycoside phosphotransferase family protein n=1 Tax=Nonomuraea sp. NPDC050404 TaxID=3155783 RepID=UPI0034116F6D
MSIEACDPRLPFARRALGPVTVVPSPGLPAHLLTITDLRDAPYVVKRHTSRQRFENETRAYQTWIPQLGDLAPALVAADPATQSLLLTMLPGRSAARLPTGSAAELHAHQSAGATLRLLHQIPPPKRPGNDIAAHLAGRLRWWTGRAHTLNLITGSEQRALLIRADRLATSAMRTATCHLDYQPRNWIIGPDTVVRVLDFEHARTDARVRDFARLEHRLWKPNPRLRTAFFDGYGHPLNPQDQALLAQFGAIEAVTALVRGHERGDLSLVEHGRTLLDHLA